MAGKQTERNSLSTTGSTKAREALEESCYPTDISLLNRISKVGKLNSQKATHFAQILNRPTRRSRTKLSVGGVDFRAVLNQELSHQPVSAKCRVVKCRRTEFVLLVNKFRMVVNDGSDIFNCASFCRLNQLLEITHSRTSLCDCDAFGT